MVEAMQITKEMKESRQSKIDKIVSKINKDIKEAVEKGCNSTYFACDKDSYDTEDFYDDVRRIFERSGYTIRPTGYYGGVWQRTEHIMW